MRSIKSIITTTLIMLVTVAIGFVSFYNISTSTQAIDKESRKHLESLAVESGLRIEARMKSVENRVDDLAAYYESRIAADEVVSIDNGAYLEEVISESEAYISHIADSIDNNLLTYITFTHLITDEVHEYVLEYDATGKLHDLGDVLTYDDLLNESDYMIWYYEPLNMRNGIWTGPYLDAFINRHMVTYSVPVIVDNRVVAIVGTDIDFEILTEMVEEVKVYETGYAFLIDEDYRFIVHPTLDTTESVMSLNDGAFQFTIPIIESSDVGSIKYHYEVDKIMGFSSCTMAGF